MWSNEGALRKCCSLSWAAIRGKRLVAAAALYVLALLSATARGEAFTQSAKKWSRGR